MKEFIAKLLNVLTGDAEQNSRPLALIAALTLAQSVPGVAAATSTINPPLPNAWLYNTYVGGAVSNSVVYLQTPPGSVSTAPLLGNGDYWGPATLAVTLGVDPTVSFSALNNAAPLHDYGAGANGFDLLY